MKFKHFLITKFNVPLINTVQKTWARPVLEKSQKSCLDPVWLEKRVELFETYCKPSVLGQTNQDFEWLILIHTDTPDLGIFEGKPKIVRTDRPDYLVSANVVRWMSTSEYVISTSLDSDDALSKNYVAEVQKHFRGRREFINLVKGVVVAHHRGFQYIGDRRARGTNHFRSFVEHRGDIQSVYAVSHGDSCKIAAVQHVKDTTARWLEVIHGGNCSNRFKKNKNDKTRPLEELAEEFSLDPQKVKNPYPLDSKGFVAEPWIKRQ